jgi:hypothetical protein
MLNYCSSIILKAHLKIQISQQIGKFIDQIDDYQIKRLIFFYLRLNNLLKMEDLSI